MYIWCRNEHVCQGVACKVGVGMNMSGRGLRVKLVLE